MALEHMLTAMTCLASGTANATSQARPILLRNSVPVQFHNRYPNNTSDEQLDRLRKQIQNWRNSQEKNIQPILSQIEMRLRNLTQLINSGAARSPRAKRNVDSVNVPQRCDKQNVGRSRLHLSGQSASVEVLCVNSRYGPGWLLAGQLNYRQGVGQHISRNDNQQDLRLGFGDIDHLDGDYFIGLVRLHALTDAHLQELLLVLTDDALEHYAHFSAFAVASAAEGYKLQILGSYEGDLALEPPLRTMLGAPFTLVHLWNKPKGQLSIYLRQKEFA